MPNLYNFMEEKLRRQGAEKICKDIWINFFEVLAHAPVDQYETIIKDFISSLDLGLHPLKWLLETAAQDNLLGFCAQYVASQLSLKSQYSILDHMELTWTNEKAIIKKIRTFIQTHKYDDQVRRSWFVNPLSVGEKSFFHLAAEINGPLLPTYMAGNSKVVPFAKKEI